IFMASTTKADADELQNKLRIPVITLEYGDIGMNREVFINSLKLIGEVLGTQSQTDSLTDYIEKQISELSERAAKSAKSVNAYIGGISYKGTKDITSTDPYYAGLQMVLANNVAKSIDPRYVSPITGTYIDIEALIEWNPDVIFIDQHGVGLVKDNYKNQPELFALLTAVNDKAVYKVWPYNNYHSNFEVMLMNAWYMGKMLYPDQFQDVTVTAKVNEISKRFLGVPVGERLSQEWGSYSENSIL
ncbi:MAG: ABC transporter substrate-binding protein, partial [Bacteroidales bacterium]